MNQEAAASRPLAILAQFAYNQEQYIRKAVEGAVSEIYKPLKITLSIGGRI